MYCVAIFFGIVLVFCLFSPDIFLYWILLIYSFCIFFFIKIILIFIPCLYLQTLFVVFVVTFSTFFITFLMETISCFFLKPFLVSFVISVAITDFYDNNKFYILQWYIFFHLNQHYPYHLWLHLYSYTKNEFYHDFL